MGTLEAQYEVETSGETAITLSGTNGWIFRPTVPVEIIRWGTIITTALTAGTALVMTANHREAGGAALTPSGAAAAGTVTNAATTLAVGLGFYTETVNPGATITTTPFLVIPGEEVQFVSGGEPNAGAGVIWVQYRRLPFQDATTTRASGDAVLTAPVADDTWLTRVTKVAS